jgi:hypothetical protein
MNTLYYGDNLKILLDRIKNEAVELTYLDPPVYIPVKRNSIGAWSR